MKRRTAFLILLLIVTVIPTVIFLVYSFLIVSFILSNFRSVQISLNGDWIKIIGGRNAIRIGAFYLFAGLFIPCIIFFIVLFLLIRDFLAQRRKKEKMRESYAAEKE